MPHYLPPPSAYEQPANPWNPGYMTLPVERTIGGFENNIWNPNYEFNPFLQGRFINPQHGVDSSLSNVGEWVPFLPDRIVYGQRKLPTAPGGGVATQSFGGKTYNVGSNIYQMGNPKPLQSTAAPGDERVESSSSPFSGFHFGELGRPGYKFLPGSMESGTFYSDQPGLRALQQYRRQP